MDQMQMRLAKDLSVFNDVKTAVRGPGFDQKSEIGTIFGVLSRDFNLTSSLNHPRDCWSMRVAELLKRMAMILVPAVLPSLDFPSP